MRSKGRKLVVLLACVSLSWLAADRVSNATALAFPNPVLVFAGQEAFETGGKSFTRYRFFVDNASAYPDSMFAASPNLPPCGQNAKASRTWVDIYDQRGKRLYGFCALAKSSDLNQIWFALDGGAVPPSWVYIELTDRSTNTKYKSGLAETTN